MNLVAQPKGAALPAAAEDPTRVRLLHAGLGRPDLRLALRLQRISTTPASGKDGGWNATRYSNPDIDKSIQGLTEEIDVVKRNAAIAKLWSTLSDETVYIALHHQMVAHAMKSDLDIPVRPDNWVHMKMTAAK